MLEVDERIILLLDEVKTKTGKTLSLIPRSNLPVRAALIEDSSRKKIAIQYSPEKCEIGDLAYELLRAIQLNDKEWLNATFFINKLNNEDIKWIKTLVYTPWILSELKRRGLTSKGILLDNFEVNFEYLKEEDPPYCHIEDSNLRLIFSAVNYAFYLLTKNEVDYGEKGVTYEELYKTKDPKALKLGEETAKIIEENKCLTPLEVKNALKEIFLLMKNYLKNI
ncbi:MAG: hypothetical protein QW487_07530 [Candidatus Bathyarchaeia archaeon]|nr:hypothetical protein [Candidatus Bathyarchaeota archaeon]